MREGKGVRSSSEDGFRHPTFEKKLGYPDCYGHFKKGVACDCSCSGGCMIYTYENKATKKSNDRWGYYQMVPIPEGFEISDETATLNNLHAMFQLPKANAEFDPDDVNMALILYMTWFALEFPVTAKALILKLNPNIRKLQDIGDLLGVTRQAVQKRIKTELGMEKRNYKASEVFGLTSREFAIYKCCIKGNMSNRAAAKELNVSEGTIRLALKKLREKGYSKGESEKNA